MRPVSHDAAQARDNDREHGWSEQAVDVTKDRDDEAGEPKPRSGYGTVPGAEFPSFVYVSVLAAFGWIMLASWLAFARDMDADLPLGIAVVLAVVFFALPVIIRHIAVANTHNRPQTTDDFLTAPIETATGTLRGSSAWLEILIIPLTLAVAATLIGAVYILVR
jgi:hypothetical protein